MSERKYNTKEEKSQRIQVLYTFAYEKFNKYINKKEANMQQIKEMNSTIKSSPKILDNPEQFEKYSLLLVEPLEKCTTRIIEIILSTMEEILKYDLVPPHILQKMVEKKEIEEEKEQANANLEDFEQKFKECFNFYLHNNLIKIYDSS